MPSDRIKNANLASAAAELLGVEPYSIYRYVSGQRYPALPTIRRIEEVFSWSISDQVRLIPDVGNDHGYGLVLGEVLKEYFGDRDLGTPRRKQKKSETWNASEVAEDLGASPSSVSRWLLGVRFPEVRTMIRIQEHLGWPVTEQVVLIPAEGRSTAYGDAFREVLERVYGGPDEV
jgi:transcriptional regulator with XRE-family HTH domain